MSDRIREAAATAIEAYGEAGRWMVAAALMGGAAIIVVRTLTAP